MAKRLSVSLMKAGLVFILMLSHFFIPRSTPVHAQEFWSLRNKDHRLSDTMSIISLITQGEKIKDHHSDSAVSIYNKAFSLSKMYGYHSGMVHSAIELGRLYHFNGQYQKALAFYNLALKNKGTAGDSIKVYNGMAATYNLLGNCKDAVQYYLKAITLVEKEMGNNATTMVQLYFALSTALHQCQEHQKAISYIDKALPLARQKRDIYLQSRLLNMKGVCLFYGKKSFAEAVPYLDSAIQLAKSIPDYQLLHPVLVNKGTLMVRAGLAQEAIPVFLEAKKITEQRPVNLNDKIATISALGEAFLSLGKYKEAESNFWEAWKYAGQLPKEKLFLLYNLADLYEAKGDYKKAFAYQKDFMKLSDSIQNKEVILAVNTLEAKYQVLVKDRKITQNQLLISNQQEKITRKNLWIVFSTGISIISVLLFAIFYFYQKQKHNALISNRKIEQLQAKIEGEEQERQRLAQELHDGINSQLAGAKSYVLAMGNIFPELQHAPVFKETNKTLNEISDNIRKVAQNLLPGELTNQRLATAIHKFCTSLTRDTGIEIEFHAYGSFTDISPSLALNIYRITQELLHNVVKHANSQEAIVLLNEHPDEISLIVEDNGKGMKIETLKDTGVGLRSVRARVQALNGIINIESEEGKGTIVSTFFPKKIILKSEITHTNT